MIEFDIGRIDSNYNFLIKGVSYVGEPISNTAMYISKKVEGLLENLNGVSSCLVFAENGINVKSNIRKSNCFVFSDNPQRDYARFIESLYREWMQKERKRKYIYTDEGYYIGENVEIGVDAYIEPGCLIGHDVVIGDSVRIFSGAVIKKAAIGNDCLVNENAVIGASGFTMTEDEYGNKFRIPTLGYVHIGNNVEIGVCDNISCGSSRNTIIEDYVKIDALVHIAHDVYLGKNVEVVAGSIIGGFTKIEPYTYVGINASIRNRVNLGANSMVGMGAVVTKNVDNGMIVVGNPAKKFVKN